MKRSEAAIDAIRAARLRDVRTVGARKCYGAVVGGFVDMGAEQLLTTKPLPMRRIERVLEALAFGADESPRAAMLRELMTRKPVPNSKVPQAWLAWLRRNPDLVRAKIAEASGARHAS